MCVLKQVVVLMYHYCIVNVSPLIFSNRYRRSSRSVDGNSRTTNNIRWGWYNCCSSHKVGRRPWRFWKKFCVWQFQDRRANKSGRWRMETNKQQKELQWQPTFEQFSAFPRPFEMHLGWTGDHRWECETTRCTRSSRTLHTWWGLELSTGLRRRIHCTRHSSMARESTPHTYTLWKSCSPDPVNSTQGGVPVSEWTVVVRWEEEIQSRRTSAWYKRVCWCECGVLGVDYRWRRTCKER